MQALPVSSGQLNTRRGASALLSVLLCAAAITGFSKPAHADDGRVVLSTGIGAIAGALIGQSIGGRNATIVGGALGAAIGASAATQGGNNYRNGPPPGYYQGGYNAYPPVQAQVVYQPPVQVYRPAPVIYQPTYQPVYQPTYRRDYQPYVRTVAYPVYYRGGHDERNDRYDSEDRRGHDGRGWERGDRRR